MPDLANMAAQASSMETVPIIITTSRIRSSSAEPETPQNEMNTGVDVTVEHKMLQKSTVMFLTTRNLKHTSVLLVFSY